MLQAGGGRPLDAETRAYFEPRFGHSFADVRVHDDVRAATTAQQVGALAYTVGRDVVFGLGRYAPSTSEGRWLLAHELAHVVQQSGAPTGVQPSLEVGSSSAPEEHAADRAAHAVLSGDVAGGSAFASPRLSREEKDAGPAIAVPPRREGADALRARVVGNDLKGLKERVFTCPPASDTVSNVFGVAGGGTLGWTKIDKASKLICFADLTLDAAAGSCTVTPFPVSLSLTSKYAKAGPPAPTGKDMPVPKCENKNVPIYLEITPGIEKKIIAAEQEHCDDLTTAFDRTLRPCSGALGKLTGTKVPGKTQDECAKALVTKLGFDPLDCTYDFLVLSNKTGERDTKGWHDFDTVPTSVECDKVVATSKPSANNKIGDPAVAPATFIPASTKCGGPAPSPAPAPPPKAPGSVPPPPSPPPKKEMVEGIDGE